MMTNQSVIFNPARPQETRHGTVHRRGSAPAVPPSEPLANPLLATVSLLRHAASGEPGSVPIPVETGAGVWLLTATQTWSWRSGPALLGGPDARRRGPADPTASRAFLGGPGGLRPARDGPPDHTRVRGLVSKAFTPRRVAELRPRIEEIVHELLEEAARGGELEVIGDFAAPLPAIVIAELLGVPAVGAPPVPVPGRAR
jgi:hypothetical protein